MVNTELTRKAMKIAYNAHINQVESESYRQEVQNSRY